MASPTHFRGIELVRFMGSGRPRVRWDAADISAVEAHLARHRLNLATYDTVYFSEILDELLARDGISAREHPEAANLIRDKVKSTLRYRLEKLGDEGHVQLGVGKSGERTAVWKPHTQAWGKAGWNGCKRAPPPPPPPVDSDVEMVAAPVTPPATPQQSEPWQGDEYGSLATIAACLERFETPTTQDGRSSPPVVHNLVARPRRRDPRTPPASDTQMNDAPVVTASSVVYVGRVPLAPRKRESTPFSDQYVAMMRDEGERAALQPLQEVREEVEHDGLATALWDDDLLQDDRPKRQGTQRSGMQQRALAQRRAQRNGFSQSVNPVDVRHAQARPRVQPQPKRRPVGAPPRPYVLPLGLLGSQANIYQKMLRSALVLLLLRSGLAGRSLSQAKMHILRQGVTERLRQLARANRDIERQLSEASIVFAVPGGGTLPVRNLYRAVDVAYP